MKEYTGSNIKKFANSGDINLIPAIIVGLQEEDNVSDVISFKNCFRQLRNLAAHEPATLLSQLRAGDNNLNQKLVFNSEKSTEDNPKCVVMDTVQFTAWMFEMFLITKDMYYLVFWKHFLLAIYPSYNDVKSKSQFEFNIKTDGLHRAYIKYREERVNTHGEIKAVNFNDPYILDLMANNPKLFWRLAIPNMFIFVEAFLTGELSLRSSNNIDAFLAFYKARE